MAQAFHWELMDKMNPGLHEKFSALSAQINEGEVIPPRYREMIIFGMACVLRSAPAIKTHGENCAKKYGVTKEELYCIMATAITLGGVPAYREACSQMEDFFRSMEQ